MDALLTRLPQLGIGQVKSVEGKLVGPSKACTVGVSPSVEGKLLGPSKACTVGVSPDGDESDRNTFLRVG